MASINYRYIVRGHWAGPADENPTVTGEKFLNTLDSLSDLGALFSDWHIIRNWEIAEDDNPRMIPFAAARSRIDRIVESGVSTDDSGKPTPEDGYHVCATAGARGPRRVAFKARTGDQSVELSFGEYDIASDLTIVTYSLFKAALLAISAVWSTEWSYAQAYRNDVVKVPIDVGFGVPTFRIGTGTQVPLDPMFPHSIFYVPWIAYLSTKRAEGVELAREIVSERTTDGGLLMSAATDRLDPTNIEHVRCARILAETLIARTS